MKKIAIFTLNGYHNYGNRLQNYATQEVLKSLGFSVITVINNTKYKDNNDKVSVITKRILNIKRMTIKEIYSKIGFKLWNFVYKNKIKKYKELREETFKNFTLLNILETEFSISDDNIPNDLANEFDYFITGSDQVWNPIFRQGSSIDFLEFAPKNKRIAYAPSFGISRIPLEYVEKYTIWLSEMSSLSVRETEGATIVKKLTGRDATVLVDPTLMLTKEKWLSISKISSTKPHDKYLLTYFLGEITEQNKKRIRQIAEKNNLKVVNLVNLRELKSYISGPSEFIDYINSASIFCTDSFHGVVFSILMETTFIVFERVGGASMDSRIETILNTFNLNSRKARNIKTNEKIFENDFTHIKPILESERIKAIKYLRDALNINN